jgi:hypothetical protein
MLDACEVDVTGNWLPNVRMVLHAAVSKKNKIFVLIPELGL